MAPFRRPFDFVADLRRGAERIRQQEFDNTVRQFVRVGELAANSVTAGVVDADVITGRELTIAAVGGSELADGAVGRVKIAGGAVNAEKVEARTLSGDRLMIGTLDGNEVADGGIGGVEIANGAITAPKLSVGQLSAISADLGTVIAGVITGATVQSSASGVRAVLDAGGLRLFNSALGSATWSSAQWFTTDGAQVTGSIRDQLPVVGGGFQTSRMEVVAFRNVAAPENTSASIAVREDDGSRTGHVQVFGSGRVAVSGSPQVESDARLKEDIRALGSTLDRVRRLTPRSYVRRHDDEREIGLVAQEVERIVPEVVCDGHPTPESPDPPKSIVYDGIAVLALAAVQELAESVDDLSARIDKLER